MPRGRKAGVTAESSRALLLDIATKLFAKQGFHETKISEIVEIAQVTQPTFYLYFRNKESMYEEIIADFEKNVIEIVSSLQLPEYLEAAALERHVTVAMAKLFKYFQANKELTTIGFYHPPHCERIKEEMIRLVKESIQNDMNLKHFTNAIHISIIASSFVGAIERLTKTHVLTGRKDPEHLAMEVTYLYFNGLKIA